MVDELNTPYLHHPNVREEVPGTGLFCFMNNERPCQSDCMAYVEPPDGPDYVGQQWAQCMVLTNVHRAGKHLTILASVVNEFTHKTKMAAADQVRASQRPPPAPR